MNGEVMKKRYISAMGAVLTVLAVSQSLQAQVVVGLDFVDTANNGANTSIGTGAVTLSTAQTDLSLVMGTVVDGSQQLGAVTLTEGGYSGVYHISVDVESTGSGNAAVGRGGEWYIEPRRESNDCRGTTNLQQRTTYICLG